MSGTTHTRAFPDAGSLNLDNRVFVEDLLKVGLNAVVVAKALSVPQGRPIRIKGAQYSGLSNAKSLS